MASAAVDCRPLRDTNTGAATLATLHTPDAISSPTAGQRTPGSAKRVAIAFSGPLFGEEAVGRKLSIVPPANSTKGWEKATVLEFDGELGQHKIRYSSSKQEEWLYLSDLRFKWAHVLPPTAPPNPTYRPEYSREAAVGKKLRVYWPAMQKWYHGMVKGYDPKSDKHIISYKDGDSQNLVLKHEPVIWCDGEAANGNEQPTASTPRHSSSLVASPRAVTSPRAATAAGTFARVPAAAVGAAAATPAAAPPPAAIPATAPPAAPPPGGAGPGRPSAALRRKIISAPVLEPEAAQPAAATGPAAVPKAPTRTGRPVGRPPGSTKARSPSAGAPNGPRGKSPGPSGPAVTAAARSALASSFAGTVFGRARSSSATSGKVGSGAAVSGGPAGAVTVRGPLGQPGTVASKPPLGNPLLVSRPPGSAAALLASRQQQLQRGTMLGKHGRDSSGLAADSANKRFKRGGLVRPGAVGSVGRPAAIADKHLAVGCRVAVYWNLDKVFYRGKITSYSPQSGKFTIKYDDGQSEQVMLERERFVWHSPRGMSAGYRPALHTLMQQLGADGLQPEPQTGVDGMVIPEVKGPEGAPHPPISGPGAVGWRIQLYWGADQSWHEAEVLSFDEARRRHHVLYLDGEEEWLDMQKENVVWLKATRHGAISAGVVTGDDVPKGRDALGWRIAVYWKDDRTFYEGEIIDFEYAAGRHKVLYNDGEEEWLHLRNERVVWRLPPSDDTTEEGTDDIDDEYDLQGSDEDVIVIDGELVTAGRGRGRGRFKPRRKMRRLNDIDGPLRARSRGLDSDSASASSGHNGAGPFALTGGPFDDSLDADGANHMQHQHFGTPAAVYSQNGLQQSATGGSYVDPSLHLQLKRGLGAGVSFRGGRGPGGLGPAAGHGSKVLGPSFVRQGSAGGRGVGNGVGGLGGHLNLPPLQLRRTSGSGEGLGSPLGRNTASAEQIQLLVRIVPGGGGGSHASAGTGAPGPAAVAGLGPNGVSMDAAAAMQPVLQTLPLREQRTALRLQKKMDRLQMILGKLAATANTMGWKLEPQQLPPTPLLSPTAAAAAAHMATLGPTSPRARALKAAMKGPPSPTAAATSPLSPRANGILRSASAAGAAGPVSPRAATGSTAAALSPSSAAKTVAVSKTCAVKSKPCQPPTQGVNGLARLKVKPGEAAPLGTCSNAAAVTAAGLTADLTAQAALLQHQQLQQQAQATYAVQGTAGIPAAVAVSAPVSLAGPITVAVPAAMLASPAVMHMRQDPAALAAVVAAAAGANNAAALGPDMKQRAAAIAQQILPAAAAQAMLAGFPVQAPVPAATSGAQEHQAASSSKPNSPPGQQKSAAPTAAAVTAAVASPTKSAATLAAATAASPTKAAAETAVSSPAKVNSPAAAPATATVAASPVSSRAPAPAYIGVSDPSAPSVQRSADDVVQMLQAIAAAQGNTSPAVQQQLQHMAEAVAAANAVAVKSPTKAAAAAVVDGDGNAAGSEVGTSRKAALKDGVQATDVDK